MRKRQFPQSLAGVIYLQGGLTEAESSSSWRFCVLLELTYVMSGQTSLCDLLSSFCIIPLWSISQGCPSQRGRMKDRNTRQKLRGATRRNVSCVGSYAKRQEGVYFFGEPRVDAFEAWCFRGSLWDTIANDLVLFVQTCLLFSSIRVSSFRGLGLSLDFFSLAVEPCWMIWKRR